MRRAEAWALATVIALAGCAAPWEGRLGKDAAAALFRDPALTVDGAAGTLTPGRSDKREVEERLGPAERLAFDSGYEVWVYRARENQAQEADSPELVLLFDPSGTVRKLRSRPAYPRPPGRRG